jgi:uncharacterized membrane protein (DUF2068 family)
VNPEILKSISPADTVVQARAHRVIAIFEGAKGVVALLLTASLWKFAGPAAAKAAEEFVRTLHVNPARHYPRAILDALAELSTARTGLFAAIALVYAGVRLAEAYGLWQQRRWAEWVAVVGASLYLPFELAAIILHPSWGTSLLLASNLLLVIYLGYSLWSRSRRAARSTQSA